MTRGLWGAVLQSAADLFPGYFALVMATGIVSTASFLLGWRVAAEVLFYINVAAYVVLWLLTLIRLARYFPRVWADLSDHSRGAGFFTLVAGTCVLGSQFVIERNDYRTATALFALGLGLWLIITYSFFPAVMVRGAKPPLGAGINGAWLIAIVGTQSVSILGTLISPQFAGSALGLLAFTLGMYLVGCALYLITITLIFYRLTFFELTGPDLTPPYWINMGAVAITTLAGATLMLNAGRWELLQAIMPFLTGFTLLFWATGTWWIPMLLVLNAWRYGSARYPIRYEPHYWSMVFPLGMYTTCTFQLSRTAQLGLLVVIPEAFIYLAWAAWLTVFGGMIYTLGNGVAAALAATPGKATPAKR